MKILISHDIDHLSVKEHIFKDLIIPKYIYWSILELIKKKISLKIFFKKIIELFKKNAWNNLKELLEFNKLNGVNSTFFISINNGKGLSYSRKQAKKAIDLIKNFHFDIGVHGICHNNYGGIKREYEIFKKISNIEQFGIRMHYLKLDRNSLENLGKVGYLFDTTILSDKLEQKYKINGLVEIPFHIMDGNLLGPKTNFSLDQAKQKSLRLLEKAERKNKKYFAILFHQRHFGLDFPRYREWYIRFINHCRERGHEFINYKNLL